MELYGTDDTIAAVYPRVCGGAGLRVGSEEEVNGLSPRVRGSLQRTPLRTRCHWSIPACAGEPWSR